MAGSRGTIDVSPVAPEAVGPAAERVAAARTEEELVRAADQCPVPMVVVDGQRRYTYANAPARLAFHLSLDELLTRGIEDLTPRGMLPVLASAWARLDEKGVYTGRYELATPDGAMWEVVYCAVTARVPDRHVIAFSPAGWPENELNLSATDSIQPVAASASELTARERQIVDLLAHGLTGEEIAARLQVSPETVRTHIRNALSRMGAKTRAHLVALVYGIGEPPAPDPAHSGRFTRQA